LLWALAHFIVLKMVAGLIFFAQHVPPKAVNLEVIMNALVHLEDVLVFFRWLLIKLWIWETTPVGFGFVLATLNSLAWGILLAAGRTFWRRATT